MTLARSALRCALLGDEHAQGAMSLFFAVLTEEAFRNARNICNDLMIQEEVLDR